MEVVNDFNLFCDSQDIQVGKGDDFRVNLGSAGIQAGDGQFIRLSLLSFNMYKNFYNVNDNNNRWTVYGVRTTGSVAWQVNGAITRKNYKTIGDLATQFAADVALRIATTNSTTAVVSAVSPDPTLNMDDTSDRIIEFTITTGISFNDIGVACYSGNDSYALVGGDEISDSSLTSSLTVTGAGTIWTFRGKYPAQRSTEEHAYLRCDAVNNNIEMAGLSAGLMPTNTSSILTSDVFAKIPIDHEFVNFTISTDKEFIMNLPNRSINSLHFYLTDSKGRPLGRARGSETAASGSTGATQTTTGNFSMSFVVKVEIIQAYRPNKLITEPPPQNPLFSKKQGVLTNMNYGAGNY